MRSKNRYPYAYLKMWCQKSSLCCSGMSLARSATSWTTSLKLLKNQNRSNEVMYD